MTLIPSSSSEKSLERLVPSEESKLVLVDPRQSGGVSGRVPSLSIGGIMSIQVQEHGLGTSIRVRYPWGVYLGGRAMCEDGVVRTLKRIAATADTFFSVPASVSVRGKTVAGYATVTDGVVRFIAYRYRRNWTAFGLKEGD